jgi:lysophospholipase L1-like esterase
MPIEHANLLSSFYDALTLSAEGTPGAITRIAHYGDSAVAADEISCTARRKLQLRFGDAGHGFMLTARGNMYYGHRDVVHRESGAWELFSIVPGKLRSGLYGYGGVAAIGSNGDYTYFGTVANGPIGRSVSRFELFYQRYNDGGDLRLSVDGAPEQVLKTHADDAEDAFKLIQVPDGEHSLAIRARGDVRLYGVSQERDVPGVVYDALGLVGARASRLLDADPKHMAAQIAHRDPDLLVLGFGGNEAGNDKLDMNRYAATLTKVIHMMRAGKPSMACLLFGPLDQGERNERGDVVTLPALPGIVEVQRRVSAAEGCAFFDTYAAMGGKGSVGRWYRARPRMFSPDFRHATPTGYAAIGEMYYQALLKGFADYLAEK